MKLSAIVLPSLSYARHRLRSSRRWCSRRLVAVVVDDGLIRGRSERGTSPTAAAADQRYHPYAFRSCDTSSAGTSHRPTAFKYDLSAADSKAASPGSSGLAALPRGSRI